MQSSTTFYYLKSFVLDKVEKTAIYGITSSASSSCAHRHSHDYYEEAPAVQ